MWSLGWREKVWSSLSERSKPSTAQEGWDVIVVGGGITGAGIVAEAARIGLKALLVEAQDFASGTSSRSTKLVHGGLRYLRQGQFRVTRESVVERERLMREAKGLVLPLGFWFTTFEGDKMPGWMIGLGLAMYDTLAGKWAHESHDAAELLERVPALSGAKVRGGYHYYDAQTDDARLVLRVLREAVARGAVALNYARAVDVLKTNDGRVRGVVLEDVSGGPPRSVEVQARVVINATGAWADGLRVKVGAEKRLRPIRGSHIVLSAKRLPLPQALTMFHPRDGRAVFAIPWEGVTIVGTTDVDHKADMWSEPSISSAEFEYILESLREAFPRLDLTDKDIRASWAGVRGVINTGARDPSKESREHALWEESGLLTVTGGKLTTFRVMALETLHAAKKQLPAVKAMRRGRILNDLSESELSAKVDPVLGERMLGRHGIDAKEILAGPEGTEKIADTEVLWSELRFAARDDAVVHLEDLLRRARSASSPKKEGSKRLPASGRWRSPSSGGTTRRGSGRKPRTVERGSSATVLRLRAERTCNFPDGGRARGESGESTVVRGGSRGSDGGDDRRDRRREPDHVDPPAGPDRLCGEHVRSSGARERLVRPRLARLSRRRTPRRRRRRGLRGQAFRRQERERGRPGGDRRASALRPSGRVARHPRPLAPGGGHPDRRLRHRERRLRHRERRRLPRVFVRASERSGPRRRLVRRRRTSPRTLRPARNRRARARGHRSERPRARSTPATGPPASFRASRSRGSFATSPGRCGSGCSCAPPTSRSQGKRADRRSSSGARSGGARTTGSSWSVRRSTGARR